MTERSITQPDLIQVNSEDLFAVLYRVPVYARDDAFYRVAEKLRGFDTLREKCHVCGAYRTQHQICCGGAQGMVAAS